MAKQDDSLVGSRVYQQSACALVLTNNYLLLHPKEGLSLHMSAMYGVHCSLHQKNGFNLQRASAVYARHAAQLVVGPGGRP